MASPNVLTFDAEGRAVDFDVWVDDMQLFLRCDSKDGVSLFDHTSGVSPAPAATADSTVRSQWTTRDAVARPAVRSHLPSAERAHFGQYKTAKSLYDAVVARYSSPATAALSRLMLPGVPLSPFSPLLLLLVLSTSLALRRSGLRLLLVGGAATARARGARVVEGTVGAAVEAVEEAEGVAGGGGGGGGSRGFGGDGGGGGGSGSGGGAAAVVEVVAAVVLVEFPDDVELPRWGDLLKQNVAIFDLDFDAILAAMYAVTDSAEGDCYLCVPPDPGIEAAALGASESAAPGAGESALFGTAPTEALHTFTLDCGASRSFFRDSTTLTPLNRPVAVSLADPSGGPVLAHSSTVLPCPAAPSGLLSGLHLPSFSTNLGRQHAAPHSSEFPPTEAPLQTLHMDVWGPACVRGQGHERYFLLVVDDYSCYTTVFPLRRKGEVTEVLIDWIRGAHRQLSESFGSDLPVLRLHSDRGGEFSSDLLRAFYRAEGIRQTFTLPASPQQNGIAERRIGMVVDVARTSMIHAAAPHFLWPFAVQYFAHQINL
ncbi:unnamed protein product [Closterium sp. Naga37s-1]|nr:unnamed protein product [Closterium sp. Naga37s-1]